MDLALRNKVAMVGGASRGLGFAVALALAREGARVSIASRESAEIESAAAQITHHTGAEVLPFAADLQSAAAAAEWTAATARAWSGVDLLFTSGGGPPAGDTFDFGDSDWQAAFDLLVLRR